MMKNLRPEEENINSRYKKRFSTKKGTKLHCNYRYKKYFWLEKKLQLLKIEYWEKFRIF